MPKPIKTLEFVEEYLGGVFAGELHAKRVMSLANGALGVMNGASLAVSIIGQSLAQARGLLGKHAIKQVDRLLSNPGVAVWDLFPAWIAEVVGARKSIVVAMDWTDFDADDQTTRALSLVTNHGRATPLLWLTILKDELKNQRNDVEDLCLSRLAKLLPAGVAVTILADRGFGDTKLFGFLDTLGFGSVIRFRGNIHVSAATGEKRQAADWIGKNGQARKLRDAEVTAGRHKVPAVVCVKARNMKEAWCLAASNAEAGAREFMNLYAQTLDHRAGLSRHKGPSLRHGHERPSHLRSAAARQAFAPQRLRHRVADPARRGGRKPRHGPTPQIKHGQTSNSFGVPPGMHALRVDPQHARGPIGPAD